jgi:hypothetical protein
VEAFLRKTDPCPESFRTPPHRTPLTRKPIQDPGLCRSGTPPCPTLALFLPSHPKTGPEQGTRPKSPNRSPKPHQRFLRPFPKGLSTIRPHRQNAARSTGPSTHVAPWPNHPLSCHRNLTKTTPTRDRFTMDEMQRTAPRRQALPKTGPPKTGPPKRGVATRACQMKTAKTGIPDTPGQDGKPSPMR